MKIILALLFAFLPFAGASSNDDRLKITEVSGPRTVKVIRSAGGREQFMEAGELLLVGDELITAKGQIVALAAFDGSQWKIAPDSRLKIEARKQEKEKFFYWAFRILKGAMWGKVASDDAAKDTFRLKVRTENAALGIRGTEYLIEGDGKRSGIDVLEGVVWWGKNPDFPAGSYREVNAGEHGEIGANGKIFVSKSKGDNAALATAYRLAAPVTPDTPESCKARGKGWKSDDGSKAGDCINE